MTINWTQAVKVMKKEAKRGMIYLLKDEASQVYYTGTRQFAIRFDTLAPEIRSKLSAIGLYEPGTVWNAGRTPHESVTENLLASMSILFSTRDTEPAKRTEFFVKRDKFTLEIFRSALGNNIYVDEQLSSIFSDTDYLANGAYRPVVMNDGVVMPTRLADDPFKELLEGMR